MPTSTPSSDEQTRQGAVAWSSISNCGSCHPHQSVPKVVVSSNQTTNVNFTTVQNIPSASMLTRWRDETKTSETTLAERLLSK